jgi:hypothetical protein
VEAFLVGHPEISREYLEKLAGLEVEKVNMARRTLQKLDNDLTSRRAEMERVGRELAQHRAQRPSETEGMTLATVEETISRLEEQQTGKLARLGAIAQMLAHHEECLRRIRKVKEQIEVKQKEVDNWAGVAALFGSADGKKFRNIAQSYVLRQLLAGANHYLSRLTDRYRMECPPGGLTILLRDEYQGGVKRPTSTISGGESFLVSLALALGLSSLNRKSLSVDVLDHKIKYKKSIPGQLKRRINVLSALFELADREFLQIRDATAAELLKAPDETAEPAPETLTDPLEPTKSPSLGSELNAFTFLKIANHFFKDFEFEPSKVDSFVADIHQWQPGMTRAQLNELLRHTIGTVKKYKLHFEEQNPDASFNPFTVIRHCLYLGDKKLFRTALRNVARQAFEAWLAENQV